MKKITLVMMALLGLAACGGKDPKTNDMNAWYGDKLTNSGESQYQTILACRTQSADKTTHYYYDVKVEKDSKVQKSENSWSYTKAILTVSEAHIAEQSFSHEDIELKWGTLNVENTTVTNDGNESQKYPATFYRLVENEKEVFSVVDVLTTRTNLTERELPGVSKGQAFECQYNP